MYMGEGFKIIPEFKESLEMLNKANYNSFSDLIEPFGYCKGGTS